MSTAPSPIHSAKLSPADRKASPLGNLLRLLNQQETVLFVAFCVVFGWVGSLNHGFLEFSNFVDMLYNCSYIGVAAIGMTMIILCGHIDISVGAALGVCATVAGKLAVAGVPLAIVFPATILAGGIIGLANGLLVAYGRIPAIVTTLGMASILKGSLILSTGGRWIYGLPPGFAISRTSLLGVPVPIFTLILFGVAFALWLKYSAKGRELYAVGGNAEAARLSGISERQVTIQVFVMNGLLVGLAAILYATNFTAIQSNVAPGFELTVITATVIGGVSILGGTGNVVGALLGALLLQTIGTALVFLHIRAEWFLTVQGSLILLTILLDVFRRRQTSGAAVISGGGSGQAASPGFFRLRWLSLQEVVLGAVLVLAVIALSFLSDRFLTPANLLNQTRFLTEVALLAVPMTFVIIMGGIDLSVGSIVAFSAVLLGFSWLVLGFPLWLAVLVGIAGGTLAGYLNGLVIVYLGVPPLIVTLATLAIFRGLAYGISESRSFNGFPDSFAFWGSGEIAGLPFQLYLLVVVFVISSLILGATPIGRRIYAIGNNEVAARFAGLRVGRIKLLTYTFSGFMAGIAGFIFTSRVTSTRADAATGLELDVIAAVVFGGTSIFGGRGTILGTALGVVTIQLLKNGLQLAGFRGEATVVLIGTVLILSILLNQFLEKFVLSGRGFSKIKRKP
ncbi:MAG: rhamnose transport system permease protein [Verrucomicrobiota bacterium]|jgi:rhamnose transport system permease protein